MNKIYTVFTILSVFVLNIFSQITFEPSALDEQNRFLFKSSEYIGDRLHNTTIYQGAFSVNSTKINALTFYPEKVIHDKSGRVIYIQNRKGLYKFDYINNSMSVVEIGGFASGEEYSVNDISVVSVSPDGNYILHKKPVSPMRSDIYLYETSTGKNQRVVSEGDRLPGQETALWSPDSKYFIYQKSAKIYYFSIDNYLSGRHLAEEWRFIGLTSLRKSSWSRDGKFIWVEKNIVYRSIPEQFYYRSIYRHYLRQGQVLCRLPFDFDPASDSIIYNSETSRIFVVKDGVSISYYSIGGNLTANPYIQLSDNMRFEKAIINSRGEGAFTVKELKNGSIQKQLVIIRKKNNEFFFEILNDLKEKKIENISFTNNQEGVIVSTSSGAFIINIRDGRNVREINVSNVLDVVELESDNFLVFSSDFIWNINNLNKTELFSAAAESAGYYNKIPVLYTNGEYFAVNDKDGTISRIRLNRSDVYTGTSNSRFRLFSRELKKGFYKDSLYIKEIFSGKQHEVTKLPSLAYSLFQPEIKGDFNFLTSPPSESYRVALIFDCIKTAEGVFNILKIIDKYGIKANFFINGNFMEINPVITSEISRFNVEVGNAFQYHVNLLENKFMIDRNFIRQGLSANEEMYFKLTGKNFSPYWHAPYYVYSESIINYGLESGYRFVSYNLDSLDWVSKNDRQLSSSYFMNNEMLIKRMLERLRPNQVIVLSAGKNDVERDEWLFNDIETLISEMIRSGYSFTFVSSILDKYRN